MVMADVALLTYSTRPRGGVVHTLALAEHLVAAGMDVEVVALGDPARGFFRPVAAPCRIIAAPEPAPTLEARVFAALDTMAAGLRDHVGLPPVVHAQDCISARAALQVRDEGRPVTVVRTVHHVDDFTTNALIECQRRSILEPDVVLVVSRQWQRLLGEDYGVAADVVPNGVDYERFAPPPPAAAVARVRSRVAGPDDVLVLTVGGIEPRKGSAQLVRALARLRSEAELPSRVVAAVVGGHSFQDHAWYRDALLAELPSLGLELDRDVLLVGTVPDDEMVEWYHAADVFAFPSVKEGWGLVVLEALAAGLPVVATDIPVFREYLTAGDSALLVPPGDDAALAAAIAAVVRQPELRDRLVTGGRAVARRYDWASSAARHIDIYRSLRGFPSRVLSPVRSGFRSAGATERGGGGGEAGA
jgi:glycosyltransferase-like protein